MICLGTIWSIGRHQPAIADGLDGDHARGIIGQWLDTQEAAAVIRELQALGQVSVGMLSGGEFIEQ